MDATATVREIIEKTILPRTDRKTLSDDEPLLDSGLIDSMGIFELVAQLEKACGVEIDDVELVPENFNSVKGIAALVNRKRAS